MIAKLKVYGGLTMRGGRNQVRTIVAAPNAETVARLINASAYYVRGYWAVTGNANEIAVAMANPGSVLIERERYSGRFELLTTTDKVTAPTDQQSQLSHDNNLVLK